MSLINLPAWQDLASHYEQLKDRHVRELFANDAERAKHFSLQAGDVFADYSKNRVTDETMKLLFALARASNVEHMRDAMFAGEKINTTEDRAVLHVALRNQGDTPIVVDGQDVMPEVWAVLSKMAEFADLVRSGSWLGHTGKPLKNIVNIGIGGSDLGPVMVTEALKFYSQPGLTVRFVSNIDGTHFVEATKDLDPAETLFIIASKTFTTDETMTNARTAHPQQTPP